MEVEDVLDQIEKVDTDSNGYVTRAELEKYFKSTNQDLAIVDNWFRWFDLENKGVIEAEDVCTTLGVPMREPYAQRVKANRERKKKTTVVSDLRSKRLIDKISDSSGHSMMSGSKSNGVKEPMSRRQGSTTSSSSSGVKVGRVTNVSRDESVDNRKSLS
ncbi:unnamed protein product, partial [Hydatigera taeniaeformis]|uniref:EF-hand domain-containing protein n=1 Tax=Hydatigena taeniaeformis TaxID=6205 RepID=A0A0R3WW77_HYDTA